MSTLPAKLSYLHSCLWRSLQPNTKRCPSCGFSHSHFIAQKYFVSTLRRCDRCKLQFRCPTDSLEQVYDFYENNYTSGFTTDLPNSEQLSKYLSTGFADTPKDFRRFLSLFNSLAVPAGSRILDLGCSWGYGAWQFQNAGYEVTGYEVSKHRALFAQEKLMLDASSSLDDISGLFDVIFSSHVLEHIPSLESLLEWCFNHLSKNGLFVAITPNGSLPFRQSHPRNWRNMWGDVHPLFLDSEFWQARLVHMSHLITSDLSDSSLIQKWAFAPDQLVGSVDGWELLVVAKAP